MEYQSHYFVHRSRRQSIKNFHKRIYIFIREHHPDSKYVFWSDLVSHYSKQTVAWMDENVKFVPKEINPPNLPRHAGLKIFGAVWYKKAYDADVRF